MVTRKCSRDSRGREASTLWSLLHLSILRITSGCPASPRGDHEPVRIVRPAKTFIYLMCFSPVRSFSLCSGHNSVPGPWHSSTGSHAAFTGLRWPRSLLALRHGTWTHPVLFLPQPRFSKEPSSIQWEMLSGTHCPSIMGANCSGAATQITWGCQSY